MTGEMKTREFLYTLTDIVRQQLGPEMQGFQTIGPTMSLVKLHYGEPAVHYEVWIQKRRGEVELGLHFEGDAESNRRHLELLSGRRDAIRSALGPGVDAELWDKGWTRVHETVPLEPLNDDFLVELSFKLSAMIRTLEPMLRAVEGL